MQLAAGAASDPTRRLPSRADDDGREILLLMAGQQQWGQVIKVSCWRDPVVDGMAAAIGAGDQGKGDQEGKMDNVERTEGLLEEAKRVI